MSLPDYAQTDLVLPAMGAWPKSRHRFTPEQKTALRAAEAAQRPLLIRGDPGTGKSQLAHAAAVATGRAFLSVVVDNRSEASDLQWRYDAVARLADAQLARAVEADSTTVAARLEPAHYVEPGPMWWAFNWDDATSHAAQTRVHCHTPAVPSGWTPARGAVLLIDEIDKAEADLPNGLLAALGNWQFSVGPLGRIVALPDNCPPPLVIVTTNDERELPAPFLRRCLVLTLELPKMHADLIARLVEVGTLHFPDLAAQHPDALASAAEMLAADREAAHADGVYMPGLAEYLDLLRVLVALGGDPGEHLDALRAYVFRKQPAA